MTANVNSGGGGSCEILVGTSGYSYREWVDCGFYPAATRSAAMLGCYAASFPVVELNYTWYQMAREDSLRRLVAGAPAGFLFAAKLIRTLTHERDDDWRHQARLYRQGIAALGRRLVAVLIQLPPNFIRNEPNRLYLARLLDELHGLPLAVEFRHDSWAIDRVFAELERRRVTLVSVDEPGLAGLFPVLDVVTNSELFYVRFHGRNSSGWRTSNMQKKFDYDYSRAELEEWYTRHIRSMASRASRGIIFFNNHVRAQAPRNGLVLQRVISRENALEVGHGAGEECSAYQCG